MADAKLAIAEAAGELGLLQQGPTGTWYGLRKGYLLQLAPGTDEHRNSTIVVFLQYQDAAKDEAVRQALDSDPQLKAHGIRAKQVVAKSGVATYKIAGSALGAFKAERVHDVADALLATVQTVVPPPPDACIACGAASPGTPALIDGTATRMCSACVRRLQEQSQAAQEAYDALPTQYGRAIPAGLAAGLVGAALWATIGIVTGYMTWLLAIGIGLGVGWVTPRTAGKGGRVIQGICILVTVVSVLAGNIMMYAYWAEQKARAEGGQVHWDWFMSELPKLVLGDGLRDTVFGVGAGCLGASYAARGAARRKLTVDVEHG